MHVLPTRLGRPPGYPRPSVLHRSPPCISVSPESTSHPPIVDINLLLESSGSEPRAHTTAPSAYTQSPAYDSTSPAISVLCRQPDAEQHPYCEGPPVSAAFPPQNSPVTLQPIASGQHVPVTMEMERNRVHMAHSGQSSTQTMTIGSRQAHHIRIPVNIESKKAKQDSSKRFRARQKASKNSSASVAPTGAERAQTPAPSAYTQSSAYDGTSPAHAVLPAISELHQQLIAEQHVYAGPPVSAALPQGLPVAPQAPFASGQYVPVAIETEHSRQNNIQIMAIRGYHTQIPVEVVSKVANEKRKRNAGASARFRARRKEKELEASMSMARLERQLRDAFEDIKYYQGERDHFKSIVFQQPGAERHHARPSSPRLTRLSSAPSNAPSSETGTGSAGSPSPRPPVTDYLVRAPPSVKVPPNALSAVRPPPQPFNPWQQMPHYVELHAP